MAPRPLLALTSLVLIAGAILLIFLTLLGGAVDKNPTNQFYFLEADTAGIAGAAPVTRWTFWNACSVVNGRNACPKVHPAYPLDPKRNFGGMDDGVPPGFLNSGRKYYYLSRFTFAFALIGLFFAMCSLFLGLLALCSRIGSFLSSALCSVALIFQALTASLMTATHVLGRHAFLSAGHRASLGKQTFGFMWAATTCLLLSTVLFCIASSSSLSSSSSRRSRRQSGIGARTTGGRGRGGLGFLGRRKTSVRERGSFVIDEERRVKGGFS